MFAFDVRHVNKVNADHQGITRYRFGLARKLPLNSWFYIKIECDGNYIRAYFNEELLDTIKWDGRVETIPNTFYVGSSIDGKYTLNGMIDGFRFLRWR